MKSTYFAAALGFAWAASIPASTASAQGEGGFVLPKATTNVFRDCEQCPEMVTLPSGVSVSRFLVRRSEFSRFVDETNHIQSGWGCVWREPEFVQDDEHPAVCVSWDDAAAYARWLSEKSGKTYRLPTLEEAQYALAGGETSNYWWGQDVGVNRAVCRGCGSLWDGFGTAPVGSFQPNAYGVVDTVGNAWQWTSTCTSESCDAYFLVGGSWANPPADLRTTKQIWNTRDKRFNTYGIRVARDE